ncbi:alpha/beta hydrolase [Lentilactobacillus sp. Marseille-Q4993]|uniref:alpha/beta hydrolase n=1 Tax=Lentilactobacillus sp. Marseille-Q4993 TaxID=3039492 RepID=UPI0024BC9D3E|nr:alpha/beta hydrolase [Lentilactobacillus sp. Marseille-Q4993]
MVNELIVTAVIFLIAVFIIYKYDSYARPIKVKHPESQVNRQMIPTIFIPGFLGNRFSFGSMQKRLVKQGIADKTLVIIVKRDGALKVRGSLIGKNPMVQVLFSQNTVRPKGQVRAIFDICQLLVDDYGVTSCNFVGHSMGCISIIWFISHQLKELELTVHKVVTIAGPFNDNEVSKDTYPIDKTYLTKQGPADKSQTYRALKRDISGIPRTVSILNIAGLSDSKTLSDGSVSVNSVRALKYLTQEIVKSYRELIFKGDRAGHRLLHENGDVDKAIQRFLWSSEN